MRNSQPTISHNFHPRHRAVVTILSHLMDWENQHKDAFHSISARELYFRLAFGHYAVPPPLRHSLKHAFYTGRTSERAMRNTIRRFEEQGLIKKKYARQAGRTPQLLPQEKLIQLFEAHTQEFVRLVQEHYFLIHKEAG